MSDPYQSYYMGAGPAPGYYPPSPTPSHAAGAPAHPGFYPAYPPARPPPPGFPAPHGTRPPGAGPSGGFPPAPPLKACGSVPRAMVNLPKGLDVRRATGGPSAPVVPPPVVDARRPHPGLSARLPPGISMSKASGISMSKASTGAGASIHPIRPLSQMRPGPVGPTPRTTPLSRLAGLSGISMQAPRNTPPAPSPTVAPTTSMSPLPTRRPGAGTMAGEAVASGPARPLGPTGLDKLKNLNLLVKPQAHAPPPLQRAPGSGVTMSPARSVAWPPVTSPSSTSVSMTPPSGFEAPRTANYEYKAEVKDVQSGELGFDLTKVKTEPGTEAQSHFAAAYVRQRAAQMRTERAKERPTPTLASPSWPTEAEAPIKSPSGGESDSGKTMESGASDGPASAPPPPHDPKTSSLLNSEAKPCVDDQPSGEPPAKEESVPNGSSHSPTSKPDSGPETKDPLIANAPINGSESLKADEGPLDHAEDNVQSSTQPSLDPIGAASHPSDNNEESSEPKNEAANFEEPMDQCDPDEMDDHEEHNVAAPHKIDTVEEPQTDRSVKDESDDLVNVSNVSSPFKKPNIVGFNDSHSQSGHSQTESRVHHESDGSVSDVSESGKSIMESNQYQNHLAFCKKPLVGQDTVCIICLTRCCEKEPKLLTCLHSACQSCFQDAIDEAKKEHKIVENVSIDEDVAPIEQEVFISCPLCKVSTSEAELAENLFIEPDGGDDAVGIQVCESCEDANPADSRCTDCEENLCEDCVKAHQRVKITKDHTLEKIALPQRRSAKPSLAPKDFFCSFHPTDRRTVFCNSCETLICNECKSAPSHLDHSMRASYEVAPEIRDALSQQISDIRLKRNTLDENRSLLGAKLNELEIKEKSLNTLLAEVKDYLLSRIEARFRGLTSELSRTVRQTRRAIDGRKATLDRFFVQTDYAIAFVDNALVNCEEDNAVLVAKRSLERQLRRLKKVDPSTGLSDNTREFKMDLYFQHFGGSQVHTSLESVLKQVLSDVKILAAPPPMPETRPKEVVAHPASSFQVTPTKNASVFMSSSAATNPGLLPQSPQITPTKNMGVARVPMRASPINPRGRGAGSSPGGRGVGSSPGGRGKNASISSRGASPARARPVSTVRGRAPMGGRGNGPRGSMRGVKPAPVSARGRGHRGASMTSVSARGRGRGPVTTMKSNRGASTMATRGKPSKGVIGQGVTISPAQPQTQSQTKKHILVLPAGTSAVPTSLLVTKDSVSGKKPQVGARMLMQPSPAQQMQQNPAQQMQQNPAQQMQQSSAQQMQQSSAQQMQQSSAQQMPQSSAQQMPQSSAQQMTQSPTLTDSNRYFMAAYGATPGMPAHGRNGEPFAPHQLQQMQQQHHQHQQAQFQHQQQHHQQLQLHQQQQRSQMQQQQGTQQMQHPFQHQSQQRPGNVPHNQHRMMQHQHALNAMPQRAPQLYNNQSPSVYNHPQGSVMHPTRSPLVQPPNVSPNSWHSPSPQIGSAVSLTRAQDVNTHAMSVPPKVDNSFKIKLPGASKNRGSTNTPAEVVDLESPENNKEENTQKSSSVTLNTITIASVEGHYNEGATRTTESTRTDDPKSSTGSSAIISLLPASEPDKGKVKQNGNEIPDLSSLLEDDYELSGSPADWVQGSHEEGTKDPDEAKSQPHKNEEVAPKDSQVHSEGTVPTDSKIDADFVSTADLGSRSSPQDIKLELKLGSLSSRPTSKTSKRSKRKGKSQLALKQEASGNDDENRWQTDDNGDEAWCAICHDGGDLLYCCDRCPKVYHLYCYIPPLTSEPPDDWVCLMCATFDEIIQFPDTPDPQSGHLSNRDLKICRRLLFEVYNQYPQSVPFRDCSDLNFPEYLAMVKQPIALDIIKERLSADNPEQYESKEMFLKDLRKMFKNCYSFHEKDSEFYRSAKELEEYLDKQLETWLPDFAYDQNVSLTSVSVGKKRKRDESASEEGSSKRGKKSDSDGSESPRKKKKKKSKKAKKDEDNPKEISDDSMSEGERLDYLDALEKSLSGNQEKSRSERGETETPVEKEVPKKETPQTPAPELPRATRQGARTRRT